MKIVGPKVAMYAAPAPGYPEDLEKIMPVRKMAVMPPVLALVEEQKMEKPRHSDTSRVIRHGISSYIRVSHG
jgi:hypothetical protein